MEEGASKEREAPEYILGSDWNARSPSPQERWDMLLAPRSTSCPGARLMNVLASRRPMGASGCIGRDHISMDWEA